MLINGKTGNRNEQQNRKTKTENLTAPLCYRDTTQHNTIFSKHNTKFSRLRNAGFVTKQSMNPYLLNREHVTRLDCKLNSS